jgi:hypothetical protein
VRLTSALFVVFFLAAGKAFDGYWGLVAWPVWALAFGYGVELVWAAARAVTQSPHQVGPGAGT